MQATDTDVRDLRDLILSMDKKTDVFIAQNTEQLRRIEQRIDLVEVNLTQKIDFTNERIDTTNQRIESLEKTILRKLNIIESKVDRLFGSQP